MLLKTGRSIYNIGSARPIAIQVISKDSLRNCAIMDILPAPEDFLTPISFALFDERAVERFIKLIQAINWIKAAMVMSITKNPELEFLPISELRLLET